MVSNLYRCMQNLSQFFSLVVAFIIHAESYICLDSESVLQEKCEAAVEKNTMLEEQMHRCSIHFFPVSQGTVKLDSQSL